MFPGLSAHLAGIYFALFAAVALACAVNVLTSRHPLNGAISLIGVMLSLAGLYALLHSPFLAVLQVLVYAGAIMMLVVFVIMVLNQARDHQVPGFDAAAVLSLLVPAALAAVVIATLRATPMAEDAASPRVGIHELAARMFAPADGWWLLFELGGVTLMAAVVGAVLLAKRRLDEPEEAVSLPADEISEEPAEHA